MRGPGLTRLQAIPVCPHWRGVSEGTSNGKQGPWPLETNLPQSPGP